MSKLIPGKVFLRVLLNRMNNRIEEKTRVSIWFSVFDLAAGL